MHPERAAAAAAARRGGQYSTSNSPHHRNVKGNDRRRSPNKGSSGRSNRSSCRSNISSSSSSSSSSSTRSGSSSGCRRRPCARHRQEASHHIRLATQRTHGVWATWSGGVFSRILPARASAPGVSVTPAAVRTNGIQRAAWGANIAPILLPGSGSQAKAHRRPNQRVWDRITPQPTWGHRNPATRKRPKEL